MKTTFLIIELTIALAFVLAFTPLGSWLRKVSHKSLLRNFCILCVCGLFCGCSSTTITEYDKEGNVVKTTKTNESAMYVGMQSLDTKDNWACINGWCLGANPSVNIYGAGAFSAIIGSINKDNGATNALGYATMLNNAKVSLDITANKDGITAKAQTNEVQTNSNGGTETKTTESEVK